ncbi:hypothetical protein DSO57_1027811 [Entomophthora muscae]|uniref:Uncharacterized protein n=1 Tax=Entomophthora muscae TaxID=34485 RepID=A0ACC2UBR5_9FUNG|nr:hypothetical protein DSO57_1027811 [Entomophthora muscae]
MTFDHFVTMEHLPTCLFNGHQEEERTFTFGKTNYDQAWFRQIFVTVHYTTNLTTFDDTTSNSTLTEAKIFAPYFDQDCNAQALVMGINE